MYIFLQILKSYIIIFLNINIIYFIRIIGAYMHNIIMKRIYEFCIYVII